MRSKPRHSARIIMTGACLACTCHAVSASEADGAKGVPDSIANNFPGDWADPGGRRASLAARGVEYGATYIGEVLSNRSGGLERGTVFTGRLELFTNLDLEKAIGWTGLSFHAHGYQIHGEGITATKVGNLNALSNIEATATTRLLEVWLEQKLLNDKLSVRLGQMAVDSEFMLAEGAGQFISASFGWPTIMAANLPNGGAAYPLSTPGVLIEFAPSEALKFRVGIFNDAPAGPCSGDPQVCNPHGLEFRLSDEPFVIVESALKHGQGVLGSGLPGTIKVGAWVDFARFDDQRLDTAGVSLADPASTGTPRRHSKDHGFYGVVDQQIYSARGGAETISIFARLMGSPADRNLIDLYADGGMTFTGFVRGRPNDSIGVAAAFARVSERARDLDRDLRSFGTAIPIRNDEVLMEVSYIAKLMTGWTVQPDFQYVWRPGGNVPDASGVNALGNSAVVGIRTTLSY